MVSLSIVICTYNRAEILKEVLGHILGQVQEIEKVEVIIVDNNSTDSTQDVITSLRISYPFLKYVFEGRQGLSIARNCGWKNATREYVFYLDDDALPDENLLMKINDILSRNHKIKAIGGIYTPWYRYGKPYWFKDEYASKRYNQEDVHILKNQTWSGGIMLIKRDLLTEYPFDENLGMTGKKIFYGEETELQYRIEKNGVDVYGTNSMVIKHIVQPYKLEVAWFFKQKKAQAKSMAIMNDGNRFIEVVKGMFVGVGLALKDTVVNIPNLFKKEYYWENFLIDSYTKPYKWWIYAIENLKG